MILQITDDENYDSLRNLKTPLFAEKKLDLLIQLHAVHIPGQHKKLGCFGG